MFNVLLRRTRVPTIAPQVSRYRYASTSTFVPPESLNDRPPPTRGGRFANNEAKDRPKPRPESPTFYTGASPFFDQLIELEEIVSTTRQALKTMQLYPLPKFALEALPPHEPVWKDKLQMADMLGAAVSTARHRRMVSTLNTLEEYKRIAETAGVEHLAMNIAEILESFEKEDKEAVLERGKRKPVQFDQYGRTYTVGRRKESSARVWVIPVQQPPTPEAAAPQNPKLEELAPFLPQSLVPSEAPAAPIEITTTNIIINNTPLNEYLYASVTAHTHLMSLTQIQPLTAQRPLIANA